MPRVNLNRDAPLNDAAKQIYQYLQAQTGVQKLIKIMGYGQTTHCRKKKSTQDFDAGTAQNHLQRGTSDR